MKITDLPLLNSMFTYKCAYYKNTWAKFDFY